MVLEVAGALLHPTSSGVDVSCTIDVVFDQRISTIGGRGDSTAKGATYLLLPSGYSY